MFKNATISALVGLFSSTAIRELAKWKKSTTISRILKDSQIQASSLSKISVKDFFQDSYDELSKKDREHEYIYKNVIIQRILLGKHSVNTTCLLSELRIGDCRADAVVLNGTATAYEIKTERDSLARMQNQLSAYQKICPEVYVVVGEKHRSSVEGTIPNQVGIMTVNDRFYLSTYRKAEPTMKNLCLETMFGALQREEYLYVIKKHSIIFPEMPNTQIHNVAKKFFSTLPHETAHRMMVEVMKKRRNTESLREFILAMPDALKASAIAVPLSPRERISFLEVLPSSMSSVLI